MPERAAVQSLVTSVDVSATPQELGRRAAAKGAEAIREALSRRGRARVILATGVSMGTAGGGLRPAAMVASGRTIGLY
jgi:hypothetical protein